MTTTDADREIVTPLTGADQHGAWAGRQVTEGEAPARVLIAWSRPLYDKAVRYTQAEPLGAHVGDAPLLVGKWAGSPVGIVAPGPGAAATAFAAEVLAAAGARVLVGAGFASSVDPFVAPKSILAVKDAVAEDGVSAHYGAGDLVEAVPQVADALELAAGDEAFPARCGRVWSTAARHRVTVDAVRRAKARGALAVDGESATLIAVGRHRGFRSGAILAIADELVRFKPLDVTVAEGEDPLEYAWQPAPAGALDRVAGGVVRAAFTALLGGLVEAPDDAYEV